jgi:outer membrane lipopolysaccharide assembly protein LptE/RlpB
MSAAGRIAAWAITVALLAAAGCGYRLQGTGKSTILPEHIKTIAVQPFENTTQRPEIEQRITEEVARELSTRKFYSVVSDAASADAVLAGTVTSFRTVPVEVNEAGRSTREEAMITLRATLRDNANDEILWSQSSLVFRTQYEVPAEGVFIDLQSVAMDELALGAAGTLVTSIVEGNW